MRGKRYFINTIAIVIFVFSIVIAAFSAQPKKDIDKQQEVKDNFYEDVEIFTDALTTIRAGYVDEVKFRDLIYGALKGMLSSLDPNSQFMDPQTYDDMKVETEGHFGGIGIELTLKDDLLTIISPIDDTPAYKAGLKSQDKIVKIDGVITRDITLTDAVKKLRGRPGTNVTLMILRESEHKIFEVTLKRDTIKIMSVKDAGIIEDNIGYVRLVDFQEDTAKALNSALDELNRKGMDGLILDMRNNPGGLLNIAVDVADKFLPEEQLIVSLKGRRGDQNVEFRSRQKEKIKDLPLVVLVNGGSASGSEIVAGAIKDNRRGIILGTKTFGKGSVQTVIPLKDGSALRLTTSKYFTPSGRSVQGEGIMPDVVVEEERVILKEDLKDREDLFEKLNEEKEEAAPAKDGPKKDIKSDNQLQRALDLIKGIKAYRELGKAEVRGTKTE